MIPVLYTGNMIPVLKSTGSLAPILTFFTMPQSKCHIVYVIRVNHYGDYKTGILLFHKDRVRVIFLKS